MRGGDGRIDAQAAASKIPRPDNGKGARGSAPEAPSPISA